MPKTVADYSDAVKRIMETDVPDDATTEAEVRAALAAHGGPQVQAEDQNGRTVADNIVSQVVTEDKIIEALESRGEIPSDGKIDSTADAFDDYDLTDRVAEVADAVSDRVATVEDVEAAVSERQDQAADRPTFREDVEGAVSEVSESKEFVGADADDVADQQAREIGAPSEADFTGQVTRSITDADQVAAADVLDDTESTSQPTSVVRDASGEPVAAIGGFRGEEVAEEIGAEFMTLQEASDEAGTAGTGDRVDVTLRGRKIGEVDV